MSAIKDLPENGLPIPDSEEKAILLVDDDDLVLLALEHIVRREGYDPILATNGSDAIAILKERSVALILCDQNMPGMKGIEVMQYAVELQPEAIRIILTGNSDEKTAIEAINRGHVSQFLTKPWDDIQLRQTIGSGIIRYRLMRQNQRLQILLVEKHKALAEAHAGLRRELLLGAIIHETLLLGKVPEDVSRVTMAACTVPSKEIDGDFFDFYRPAPEIFDIVIGDVMGKGVPAAVVGTAVKTHLIRFASPVIASQVFDKFHHWKENILSPEEIIARVHEEIALKLIRLEYFVCLFYGRFDFDKHIFHYVNCGSPPPIHYRKSKKNCVELIGDNYPLGMVEKKRYEAKEIYFCQGDTFVFYSDGVTEARSPGDELFGYERLKNVIAEFIDLSAEELLEKIKEAVTGFAEKEIFDDDLTLIVMKADEKMARRKEDTIEARFSGDLSELKSVREFVAKACKQAPGDRNMLTTQMQLVVNEAFSNLVEHSYKHDTKEKIIIKVDYHIKGVIFEISDRGDPFNPAAIIEPSLEGDRESGFGWHIIRSLSDEVAYIGKKNKDGWNHLRIYKQYFYGEEIMELVHKKEGEALVITPVSESLDAKDAPDFKQKVVDLILDNKSKQVVFDLGKLKFIDSSGLGAFLAVLRTLNSQGGDLKLANMSASVRAMFELVSMHKIFDIFGTTEEAIRSFDRHKPVTFNR